jgi:hypothetical protein
MFLMLTAHSKVTGLDEKYANFTVPPWPVLAVNLLKRKRTVYKLPMMSGEVDRISELFPKASIVWMIRHPFAVVASMRNLKFEDGQSWLEKYGIEELEKSLRLAPDNEIGDLQCFSEIEIATLIWKKKLLAMDLFTDRGMNVFPVLYEDLVDDPGRVMMDILQKLNINWEESVLEHHRYHGEEQHAGKSAGNVPVDKSRKARGDELTEPEKAEVTRLASDLMERVGYT